MLVSAHEKSLMSCWLRLSRARVLGLHEDTFGLQPITFSSHEEFKHNCTLHVWFMLAMIVGGFAGQLLR